MRKLKTLVAVIRFFAYLVTYNGKLKKVKKLTSEGKIKERDEFVAQVVSEWGKYVVGLSGKNTSVTVSGQEQIPRDGAVVFIANHQGYMDIPIMLGYIDKPKAFISKIEILKVPMLSSWMKMMECIFLDRKNPRQSVKAMQDAVETVKKGYSLVIFPEGTRSRGKAIAEMKAGSFRLAFKAEVPIVPVTIDGSWRLFEKSGGLESATVKITVHPPVLTAGLSKDEQHAIPEQVQKTIESAMSAIK